VGFHNGLAFALAMGYLWNDKLIACIVFPPFTQPHFSGLTQFVWLRLSFAFRLHLFLSFSVVYLTMASSSFLCIAYRMISLI